MAMELQQALLPLVDDYVEPERDELQLLLDYLFSHHKKFIQDFLRSRIDLLVSGTKAELRDRFDQALKDGRLVSSELVDLLDRIEGWGNQQVFLYRSNDSLVRRWANEESVRERLEECGLESLLNRRRPLILPDEPTLSSIEWLPERVRFLWVERRTWEERMPDRDRQEEDLMWRAYRARESRGVVSFDWSLVSNEAALMIQRLPRGTVYDDVKEHFEGELEPVIGIREFEQVRVARAIERIEHSEEADRRKLAHETRRGGRASFTSRGRTADVYADPDLQSARTALGNNVVPWLGNFYWKPVDDEVSGRMHVVLHTKDNRVGVYGEWYEEEVRHVLSRIRTHCG